MYEERRVSLLLYLCLLLKWREKCRQLFERLFMLYGHEIRTVGSSSFSELLSPKFELSSQYVVLGDPKVLMLFEVYSRKDHQSLSPWDGLLSSKMYSLPSGKGRQTYSWRCLSGLRELFPLKYERPYLLFSENVRRLCRHTEFLLPLMPEGCGRIYLLLHSLFHQSY